MDNKNEKLCEFEATTERKKLWKIELNLLKELDKVCQKYGLRYFADSGTLLGAIRHKGFIPWDDDIDVVMFRSDYDKLLEVAPNEMKKPIFFQCAYTDKGYYRSHSQIRDIETTAVLETEGKDIVDFEQGVFLDIFPLDEVSKYSIIQHIKLRRLNFMKKMFTIRFKRAKAKNPIKQVLKIVVRFVLNRFNYQKAYKRFERVCKTNLFKSNNYSKVSYYYKTKQLKRVFNKELYEKQIWVPFEDTKIPVPNGYDLILKKFYGEDYMKPKHIQSGHKIEKILVNK